MTSENKMGSVKVAVVTGGNKGIGLSIVKGLCQKFDGIVYLTSRDDKRGLEAVNKLNALGLKPAYHQLDINDLTSITNFYNYLNGKYGGIDLLVNNAAIIDNSPTLLEQATKTIETNYFSLLNVCEVLFPLLRQNARVVNVSSGAGHLSQIPSLELRGKLSADDLTIEALSQLMKDYINAVRNKNHVNLGWNKQAYYVSKVGVCALTRVQQRLADRENPKRNLLINSVHPGYVATDMTNFRGYLTVDEGARAPLFTALGEHNYKGEFIWRDNNVCDWLAEDTPTRF